MTSKQILSPGEILKERQSKTGLQLQEQLPLEKSPISGNQEIDRILREPEVRLLTGLARSTRFRMERAGLFPKKVRLSRGAVGWRLSDIRCWLESRPKADDLGASLEFEELKKKEAA